MPIEVESPEEYGYARIRYNLSESSVADQRLSDLGLSIPDMPLLYGEHRGRERLRELIAADDEGLSAGDVLVKGSLRAQWEFVHDPSASRFDLARDAFKMTDDFSKQAVGLLSWPGPGEWHLPGWLLLGWIVAVLVLVVLVVV